MPKGNWRKWVESRGGELFPFPHRSSGSWRFGSGALQEEVSLNSEGCLGSNQAALGPESNSSQSGQEEASLGENRVVLKENDRCTREKRGFTCVKFPDLLQKAGQRVGYKESQRKNTRKWMKEDVREGREQILEIQILSQQTLQDYESLGPMGLIVRAPDVSPVQWGYVEFVTGERESLLSHLLDEYH